MSRQRRPAAPRTERAAEPAPRAGVAATVPAEASAKSSFGALFFFCLGALVMQVVLGVLPPLFSSVFAYLVYAGIALSIAVAYRRFVRRSLEARRRERQRQQERAARS